MTGLVRQVADLVANARVALADTPAAPELDQAHTRLVEPLRVAIAGKVKAGKSTVLNALVSDRLAPTDARECTKVLTWYRTGTTYRVSLHPSNGEPRPARFSRRDGSLDVDLDGIAVSDVGWLDVEWPSSTLDGMTLIDTPGIDSISTDLSARTHDFLISDERAHSADAVLYLMRHAHESDVRFLEAFHDQVVAQPAPVNSIGVLSRADEIGVGKPDSLQTAHRIAKRYSADPKLRRLVQTVVPLAGLLAETAVSLREDEFQRLRLLSELGSGRLEELLVSVDRFAGMAIEPEVTAAERAELLDRFGVFGVRLACHLIGRGEVTTSQQLATHLRRASGLEALRSVLQSHFADRSDVLRARSGLLTLERILHGASGRATRQLEIDLERLRSGVHEFAELRLLHALRTGQVELDESSTAAAERLLGAAGSLAHQRLGADDHASLEDLRSRAFGELGRWRRLAENPLLARDTVEAVQGLVRTCEGLIAAMADSG